MPRPHRTVSLRRSLLANLTLGVILLGGGLLLTTFLGVQRGGQRLAAGLIRQAHDQIESELDGFFDPVSRQLAAIERWIELGGIESERPEALDRLLDPIMRSHPWMTSMMVADLSGREHLLLRVGDGWLSRQSHPEQWGSEVRVGRWNDGQPRPEAGIEEFEYDVRTRPWFTGAVELERESSGGIYWTKPYVFATTRDPGITASKVVRDANGAPLVVGIDLLLTDITGFTQKLEVGGNGRVFVLSDDGRLVGLPRGAGEGDPERIREALLTRPEEWDDPLARDASAALLGPILRTEPMRFIGKDEPYWGVMRPFDLPASQTRLLVGVMTAERELLDDLRRQRLLIGVLTMTVLALAIARAVSSAKRYSRPLEHLAEQSERISRGDFEATEPVVSNVTEVRRLAEAQEKARRGLQSLFKLERDLQLARQIQQKTLPENLPSLAKFDMAAWNQPADETGGDTYDVIGYHRASIGDRILLTSDQAEEVVFLLADATGHGIGPALSVTQLRAMLRMAVRMSTDLGGIARSVNEQLFADLPRNRFITAWFGKLDPRRSTLLSYSAGQAPLLLYRRASDSFERRNADTVPLGMFEKLPGTVPEPIELARGDLFAAISDGIFEAEDSAGEQFEKERTEEVLRRSRDLPGAETITALQEAVEAFTGGIPPNDDRTVVLIRRL